MRINSINYPAAIALAASVLTTITVFPDIFRVPSALLPFYLTAKIAFIAGTLLFSGYFHFKGEASGDLSKALLFLLCIGYCLSMSWILPLYETAYVQCALGCAFFKTTRKWLFPTIFGLGVLGFAITYEAQEALSWQLPPVTRKDWVTIVLFFFLVTWVIQKYAINKSHQENERLLRLSRIGHDSQRLLHDLKGMLSSPILLFESMNADTGNQSVEAYKEQIRTLNDEMKHARDMLKSINLMSKPKHTRKNVCVAQVFNDAAHILRRRLAPVQIHPPESRQVHTEEDVLRSVFFNLILNTLEASERNKVLQPSIRLSWNDDVLTYQNNAGSDFTNNNDNPGSSGLGLDLLVADLNSLGIKNRIYTESEGLRITMKFPKDKS